MITGIIEQPQSVIDKCKMLIDVILSINGDKIITIVGADERASMFDISADGVIGYDETHKCLFTMKLVSALSHGGSIIIRAFTNLKAEMDTPKGKMMLPIKKLYGLAIVDGRLIPMSEDQVEDAFSFNSETGERMEPEKNIIYCDFPMLD